MMIIKKYYGVIIFLSFLVAVSLVSFNYIYRSIDNEITDNRRTFKFKKEGERNSEKIYDLSFVKCEENTSSNNVQIAYKDSNEEKIVVYFDCFHGATGNTSNAVVLINTKTEEIKDFKVQSNDNLSSSFLTSNISSISPNERYLVATQVGNGGACSTFSTLGLLDLETLEATYILPESKDYEYLITKNIRNIDLLDSIDTEGTIWDKYGNLIFKRTITGCGMIDGEGGFFELFIEKWKFNPREKTYKLLETLEGKDAVFLGLK